MPRKSVAQQPSTTALFTCLRRALAYLDDPGGKFEADSLALAFLPTHYRFFLKFKKVQDNTRKQLAQALPGMTEYVIARTAFFDRLFVQALQEQAPQIVLLGAGYDSRAYRFAHLNQGTRVYELDSAPTQNSKIGCLKKAKIEVPPQVKFTPIDFNQESLGDVLAKAGFLHAEKTLFIWEGVCYYLDPASVDATLSFVSQFSRDSMIAFDYTVTVPAEDQEQYYGLREFSLAMQGYHKNERLTHSLGEGEIDSFLTQRNLQLLEHMDKEKIEQTFLLKEDGELLGQITAHFRFATASPLS